MTTTPDHRRWHGLAVAATFTLLALAGCATPGVPGAGNDTTPITFDATGAGAVPAEGAVILDTPSGEVATPVPVDPVRPGVPFDLDDRAAQADLWARVRRGFAMPDLESELVRDREQWYATRPDYVDRMTRRGSRYMYHIVEELNLRGMPMELALLPFIESAFNPQAMSTAKASGMWQFIPSTGKDFALTQNIFRDDRRDVLASTRAALDYLQKLHGMFGDWHLALAAYNWGEGSVSRAIARNQKAGLPTDYQSLRMPNETQYYVPKLQAVKNIIARPADFNLTLPTLANHPYFLSVPIEHDMDLALAAQLAGLSLDEFKDLNPQMNKPVILAAGTPQVLLPYDNADRFIRALPRHRGPLASWTAWVTDRTMKPADAAREAGMSEDQLRDVNKIPPRMLIKAGSTLLIPRVEHRHADVTGDIADNAVMALAPEARPLRKISFQAGKRDTVATVARRHRVSPVQLAEWNNMAASAAFKPGQAIVIYAAATTPRARRAHVASTGSTRTRTATATATRPTSKLAAKSTTPTTPTTSTNKVADKAPPNKTASKASGKVTAKTASRPPVRVAKS